VIRVVRERERSFLAELVLVRRNVALSGNSFAGSDTGLTTAICSSERRVRRDVGARPGS
jgi:hypothetical protein